MSYEAKLKELRDRRAQHWNESQEILRRVEKENEGKAPNDRRDLTTEEDINWRKAHEDMKSLSAEIERYEEQRKRDEEMGRSQGVRAGRPDSDGNEDRSGDVDTEEERAKQESVAFRNFLRYGVAGLPPEQREIMVNRSKDLTPEQRALSAEDRAQSVAVDSGGGFMVPSSFAGRVVEAQLNYGGMRRSRAFVLTTGTGESFHIPTDNDTSNKGAILAENNPATEQDVTVGQVILRSYTYTSKLVRVSRKLIRDAAFDVESWLANKLGIRLGRATNEHFTTGDASAKPQGIVTGATLGVTGGATGSVTLDELYALKHSVDPDYRTEAEWMFSDNSLLKVKQLKDGEGRTLWQPGMADGTPSTIDGDRYVINQDVANMAASAKSILYGDFSNYWIRDVAGTMTLLRMEERYAEYLQVAFLAFSDHDGVLVDAGTNPVKYFQNAA